MKQESTAIDAQYEKKKKGAETALKMCVSSQSLLWSVEMLRADWDLFV